MAKPAKVWRVADADAEQAASLARKVGISPVVAQVLLNRGIGDADQARRFLYGGVETLPDPFLLQDMATAVARLKTAIDKGEKITVYGDYDVDGITATALVYRVLARLGAVVEYYIPERQSEGYGLNDAALEALCQGGTNLVVTVDCGINSATEIARIAGRLDVIVSDHHQPPPLLPPAVAVLNPKRVDCPYPEKNLAGVGVAFKLCQALWRDMRGDGALFMDYLELVAVGTIADIVPLTGENRILVKLGLAALSKTANPGLRALMKVAGLAESKLDAGKVGYILAPRLNAAGRISHAAAGVELLTTEHGERAAELAAELDGENAKRQQVEKELLTAAEAMLAGGDTAEAKVIVLAGADWHPGVIGIVASRLVDRYYRPVVMISIRDGVGKGSCRSIPGFDIYQALQGCSDLLLQFGGHQQAAGLTIEPGNIDAFRERLSGLAAATLAAEDYIPKLNVDFRVALAEIDAALLEELACLAPHGMGNPSPLFVCEDLAVAGVKPVGAEGRHLKLRVRRQGASGDVIAWDMGGLAPDLTGDASIDLAFLPEFNEWQGQRHIQLKARDVRLHEAAAPPAELVDARETADKLAYLLKIAAAGTPTVVLVNDRQRAVTLARRLRRELPAAKVGWCHQGTAAGRRERLRTEYADGNRRILVAAGYEAAAGLAASSVVLWSPPLSIAELFAVGHGLEAQAASARLHFLYGAADIQAAAAALAALFPDRTAVGWVYLALKEAAGPEGGIKLPLPALARTMARLCGRSADVAELTAALAVLTELGLVSRGPSGELLLQPAPAAKLAIETSATFQAGKRAREGFERFRRELLRLSPAELWKQAVNGV
jgi:single-stranded-DNA-specific exonuclease